MSKRHTKQEIAERAEAVQQLKDEFARVDSGKVGFFIATTGETRGGYSTHVRLYVVENNQPRDITETVLRATGCGRSRKGDISLGGWGVNRHLTLMYNIIGFTLFSSPRTADSQKILAWAHKYYRSVL
jgi:hypothetical protein